MYAKRSAPPTCSFEKQQETIREVPFPSPHWYGGGFTLQWQREKIVGWQAVENFATSQESIGFGPAMDSDLATSEHIRTPTIPARKPRP